MNFRPLFETHEGRLFQQLGGERPFLQLFGVRRSCLGVGTLTLARTLLLFGEENRPPFWGHTFYIGLNDHLISPFLTGYEGTALASLYPSSSDLFSVLLQNDSY